MSEEEEKPQESKRLASTHEMCRKQRSTRLLTHPMKRIGRSRRHLSEVQKPKSPQTNCSEHAEACRALSSLSIDNNYLRPGVTPPVEEESCLPPELCSNCPHVIKLGLCPEASSHVEQMTSLKDKISDELLDNSDLSGARPEWLSQKRSLLKKQIELLETHIRDKDRQNSQVLSSTATPTFQYETPKSHTDFLSLPSDQGRYACDSWNMPRDTSFSVENYGFHLLEISDETSFDYGPDF